VKLSQREGGEIEFNRKISIYESNVVNLTRVNEEMQRKLTELDTLLRQRTEDCNRFEIKLKNAGV